MSGKRAAAWCVCAVFTVFGGLTALLAPMLRYVGLVALCVGVVIACFLGLSALAKKHRKAAIGLRIALSVCLALGLGAACVTGGRILRAAHGSAQAQCDYLIVLGAQVQGTSPSRHLRERIDAAYAYLCAHPQTVAVVSGGEGSDEEISEASCMARELAAMGIAPERIWQEDASTDTRENFRFSLALIEEKTHARPERVAFVTSDYHVYRAAKFAREAGCEPVGVSAHTSVRTEFVNFFLREIAAVWYYAIFR